MSETETEAVEGYVPLEGDVIQYGDMPIVEAVTEDGSTYDDTGNYLPSTNELIEEQKKLKKKPTTEPTASLYVQGRQKKLKSLRTTKSYPGMGSASTLQKVVPQSAEQQVPASVEVIGVQPEFTVPLETEELQIVEPNIISKQIRMTEYNTEKKKNTEVASGDIEEILDQSEDGELVAVSIAIDNPAAIPEIAIFGDSDTYIELNAMDVDELVAEGNGLTPGDVKLLPSGESPDRPGENDGVSVYVARYKADTINTWKLNGVATTRPCYVVKYRPEIPFPYKAIFVGIRNNASSTVTIYAARVSRILHTITEYEVHDTTGTRVVNQNI